MQSEPREVGEMVTVLRREAIYKNEIGKISYGWEIVKEIRSCKSCVEVAKSKEIAYVKVGLAKTGRVRYVKAKAD
jgi:hypothetical protein